MKKLFFMRHAQAEYNNFSDHERILTNHGKEQAIKMADFFIKQQELPDLIIYSSAIRTYETAKIIAEKLGISSIPSIELYQASHNELINIIQSIDENCCSVLIIGHNPLMTEFSNTMTKQSNHDILTFTPGACVAFELKLNNWAEFDFNNNSLKWFKNFE